MILIKSGGAFFSNLGFPNLGLLTGVEYILLSLDKLLKRAFLQGGDSPPLTKVGLILNLPVGVAGGESSSSSSSSSSSEDVIGSWCWAKWVGGQTKFIYLLYFTYPRFPSPSPL